MNENQQSTSQNEQPANNQANDNEEGNTSMRGNYARNSMTVKELLVRMVLSNGTSISEAARQLCININTAKTIVKRAQIDGQVTPDRRGGRRNIILTQEVLTRIETIVENNPAATLIQIKNLLANENVILSKSSVENGLKKLMISLKKARIEYDRVNCERTLNLRSEYALEFSRNAPTERNKWIYIDESGFIYLVHRLAFVQVLVLLSPHQL